MYLRLQMAGKEGESDIVFATGADETSPLEITGVHLDEDGDVCLECDERLDTKLSPEQIADAVSGFDPDKDLYFLYTDKKGETVLYNIKDGGTIDRDEVSVISAETFAQALEKFPSDDMLHFETGTVNYTINSVYLDDMGDLCLESNEIMELDDYPVGMIIEELRDLDPNAGVYFYDDESMEYYGILPEEYRIGKDGGPWFKIR